jgi:hypothetical protein
VSDCLIFKPEAGGKDNAAANIRANGGDARKQIEPAEPSLKVRNHASLAHGIGIRRGGGRRSAISLIAKGRLWRGRMRDCGQLVNPL